jgi:CrcB protein
VSVAVVLTALVAGALGALLRYGVALFFSRPRSRLPIAVLLVNVVGSLLAGVILAVAEHSGAGEVRYVLVSGFAGGLTTFSTFGVETVQLVLQGRIRIAIASVAANVVLGVAAVAAGWAVANAILG